MATVNPYITFLGNCEEAFNHYKSVFGGEFSIINRFSEMPPQEGMELPKEALNKIMHITLPISDETLLMGSDTGGEWAAKTVVGNNITISITADSKEQADHFFNSLSEGGRVNMPMDKTFWGSYFGMCTDKFDINWMISFGQTPQE
jgi:PhnB protein